MGVTFASGSEYAELIGKFLGKRSSRNLKIAAPFITGGPLKEVAKWLNGNSERQVLLLTDLNPVHIAFGALDAMAIWELKKSFEERVRVYQLDNLHAKVTIFDSSLGFVGSSNFTRGGLVTNHELGLSVKGGALSELEGQLEALLCKSWELEPEDIYSATHISPQLRQIAKESKGSEFPPAFPVKTETSVRSRTQKVAEYTYDKLLQEFMKSIAKAQTASEVEKKLKVQNLKGKKETVAPGRRFQFLVRLGLIYFEPPKDSGSSSDIRKIAVRADHACLRDKQALAKALREKYPTFDQFCIELLRETSSLAHADVYKKLKLIIPNLSESSCSDMLRWAAHLKIIQITVGEVGRIRKVASLKEKQPRRSQQNAVRTARKATPKTS